MNKEKVKTIVHFVVSGLVDMFSAAVISSTVDHLDGSKLAKLGAKTGGILVGVVVGDKVADYVCDQIDDITEEFAKIKEAVDEEE